MLFERFRPQCWNDVVGQEKIVAKIMALKDRGTLGGRAFMVTGKSGHGKTTIARLIAAEIAEDYCINEFDAKCNSAATARRAERVGS
jgi:DNA polymerase III gamma/tau subunit